MEKNEPRFIDRFGGYFIFSRHKAKRSIFVFRKSGKLKFAVSSKKKVSSHKWLTMDAGDTDNDGDKDIILGAFNRELRKKTGVSSVVILENSLKK